MVTHCVVVWCEAVWCGVDKGPPSSSSCARGRGRGVEPAFVAAKGRVVGVVWCVHQLLWWRRDATAPSTVHVVVCPLRQTERGEGWSGGRVDVDGVVSSSFL